jgi:hypothetical protein
MDFLRDKLVACRIVEVGQFSTYTATRVVSLNQL